MSVVERGRALRAARHERERIAHTVAAELQAEDAERVSHLVTVDARTLAALARTGAKPKPKPKPAPKLDDLDDLDGDDDDEDTEPAARAAMPVFKPHGVGPFTMTVEASYGEPGESANAFFRAPSANESASGTPLAKPTPRERVAAAAGIPPELACGLSDKHLLELAPSFAAMTKGSSR